MDNDELLKQTKLEMWDAFHRIKILKRWIVALCLVIVIGTSTLLYANNYAVLLAMNGLTETQRLEEGFTISFGGRFAGERNKVRVIFSHSGEGLGEFVALRRNSLGFWSIFDYSRGREWRTNSGGVLFRSFAKTQLHDGTPWSESVYFYHNINAVAPIIISNSDTEVILYQWDNSYVLRFRVVDVHFSEIEEFINNLVKDFIN